MSNSTEPSFIDGKGSDFIAFEEYIKNSPKMLSPFKKKRKKSKVILITFLAFSALVSYKIITAQTLITNNIIDIEISKKIYTEERNETQKILDTISILYLKNEIRADTFDKIKKLSFNEQVFLANNYSKFILNLIFFGSKDVEINNEEIQRILLIYSDLVSCVIDSSPKLKSVETLIDFKFITFQSDGTQKDKIYEEKTFNNYLNQYKLLQLLFTDKYITLQNQKNLSDRTIESEANIVSFFMQSDMILDFNSRIEYFDYINSDLISLNKKIYEKVTSNERDNKIYKQFWEVSDYQKKVLWDNYYKKDYEDYFNKKIPYKNVKSSWFINSNLDEKIKNEGIEIYKVSKLGIPHYSIHNLKLIPDFINSRYLDTYINVAPSYLSDSPISFPPMIPPIP